MKKDYKKDFWKLVKKTNIEIKFNLKFFPKDKFINNIYKENQQLIKDGKNLKTNNDFKRVYDHAIDIMFRHDDWMFDGRFYVKTVNKPIFDKNLFNIHIKRKHPSFTFNCGDLLLRKNVDSYKDILTCYSTVEKFFKNLKNDKFDKFRWGMDYTYPNEDQIELLKNSQKFKHNLSLNSISFHPISYNMYSPNVDGESEYPVDENTLLLSVNLLNQNIDPLINFAKCLNNLKKIEFNDNIVNDIEGTYNSSRQSVNFPVRYRDKFNNPRFLNPYANDWEFGHDSTNDKIIINNLKKLKESLDKKITFFFNSIDYYGTSVQEILKLNGLIKKITSFKGIYY